MKTHQIRRAFLPLIALFVLCAPRESEASFISPTKVYIEDGQNSASVSITNTGDETLVYQFEWERRARSQDGQQTILLKEGETMEGYNPADPYLIYSPRKVVVQPDETQRVRILARRPADMPAGEYRSHLKITSETVDPPEKTETMRGEFGGVLAVRPGVSIPVMLRTGKTVVDMKITSGTIIREENVDVVEVNIVNNSTRSIYGKSSLKCLAAGGQETETKLSGFRLYAETKTLNEKFAVPEEVDLGKCASINFELYSAHDSESRNGPVASVKLK